MFFYVFMICDALRNLIVFMQFQKREKQPLRSVIFKVALLHGCFLRFLNCANATKSRNASHMYNAVAFL